MPSLHHRLPVTGSIVQREPMVATSWTSRATKRSVGAGPVKIP